MKKDELDSAHEPERQGEGESTDHELQQAAADAIAEVVVDADMHIEADEAVTIASEILEKFTSPLMIQKAAGATSSVSVVGSPDGGVESGRSVKATNILRWINLKDAAFALPSTLPTLATLFDKNGASNHVRIAMAAVIALFAYLRVLSGAFQIPLTKRTAGVLRVMWLVSKDNEEVVHQNALLENVNSQFEEYKWQAIDADELLSHLETLEKIGCIEKDEAYSSILMERIQWRLKEKVKLTY